MRYLIFGTGAVGGLMGARLALAGQSVTFLTRPRLTETLRHRGLQLTGDVPTGWLKNPSIITTLDEAFFNQSIDIIILTVKSYDCQEAAEIIVNTASDPPVVLCMLNGVGNEETLASVLGPERVIAGTMTTAVQMIEPGVLRVERQRGYGLAGQHPLLPRLLEDMVQAGLRTRRYRNAERMKWSKLLTNIVTNATSAITGWLPRRILDHPGLYRLEIEALREAVRVMRRKGFSPQNLPGVPVGLLGTAIFLPASILQPFLRRVVARGRGDKLPSFNYDFDRGRSEAGWLNGAIVREGARLGVPTPANAMLTDTLLDLIEGREGRDRFHDQPDQLIARAVQVGVPGFKM